MDEMTIVNAVKIKYGNGRSLDLSVLQVKACTIPKVNLALGSQ